MIPRYKPLKRSWIRPKPKRHRELKGGRVILDGPETKVLREQIFDRSEGQCEWVWRKVRCENLITWESMTMHHAKFRSHGGSDSLDNCRGICRFCNGRLHPGPQWSGKESAA